MNSTKISDFIQNDHYHVKVILGLNKPEYVSDMDKEIQGIADKNHFLLSITIDDDSISWHVLSKNTTDEKINLIIKKVKKTAAELSIRSLYDHIKENTNPHPPISGCIEYKNSSIIENKEIQYPIFLLKTTKIIPTHLLSLQCKFLLQLKVIDPNFFEKNYLVHKITYKDKIGNVVLESNMPQMLSKSLIPFYPIRTLNNKN